MVGQNKVRSTPILENASVLKGLRVHQQFSCRSQWLITTVFFHRKCMPVRRILTGMNELSDLMACVCVCVFFWSRIILCSAKWET